MGNATSNDGYGVITEYRNTLLKVNVSSGCWTYVDGSAVNVLGYRAFRGCSVLETIEIPTTITEIHEEAFFWCGELSTMKFYGESAPDIRGGWGGTFDKVQHHALRVYIKPGASPEDYADKLKYSHFGRGNITQGTFQFPTDTSFDFSILADKKSIEIIHAFPSDASAIDISSVIQWGDLTNTTQNWLSDLATSAPFTITSIGKSAFREADLSKCILPNTIERIRFEAFRASKITEIIIPASVRVIEKKSFSNCNSLRRVYFNTNLIPIATAVNADPVYDYSNYDSSEDYIHFTSGLDDGSFAGDHVNCSIFINPPPDDSLRTRWVNVLNEIFASYTLETEAAAGT